MNGRRIGLAILLAALAAAGVWMAMSRRETATAPSVSGESPRAASSPAPTSAPAVATARTTELGDERTTASTASTDSARSDIRVQVIDSDERPVLGAMVCLAMRTPTYDLAVHTVATSGPDAIASIPQSGVRGEKRSWCVRLAAPIEDPDVIVIDPADFPRELLRLRMPPTGRVSVLVVDREGRPVLDPTYTTLAIESGRKQDAGARIVAVSATRPSHDGRTEFPHVGLGLLLRAATSVEWRRYQNATVGAGPKSAGERVELRIVADTSRPFASARVLSAQRAPLASSRFEGRLVVEGGDRPSANGVGFNTDADGRFRLEVVEDLPNNGSRRIELHLTPPRGAALDPALGESATIDLGRPLAPGVNDLGDVVLELDTAPTLATGIVLDDDDKPVAGARLRMEQETSGYSGSEPGHGKWEEAGAKPDTLVSDSSGRFAVRGRVKSGLLRVMAWKDSTTYSDNPIVFNGSADDIELRLHRAGGLEGSVLLAEGVAPRDVTMIARMAEPPNAKWLAQGSGAARSPQPNGSFSAAPLRAGTFTVEFEIEHHTIATVPNVEVRVGEPTRDPRLQRVDLRGSRFVTISAVDGNGEAVANATAQLASAEPAPNSREREFRAESDGRIRFLLMRPSQDLIVDAPGFRPETLRGVKEDTRVILRRGIPIRAQLAGESKLPTDPPVQLSLELTLTSERDRQRRDPQSAWPPTPGTVASGLFSRESGEAVMELGMPGNYFVGLSLRLNKDGGAYGFGFSGSPTSIRVDEGAREQTFTITIEKGEIETALARLDKMIREQRR